MFPTERSVARPVSISGGRYSQALVVTQKGSGYEPVNNGGHGLDAAVSSVLSELDGFSSFNEEQGTAPKPFFWAVQWCIG